jgi:hypothetical protein
MIERQTNSIEKTKIMTTTILNQKEAFVKLINEAKAKGATKVESIIPNSGSEKNIEIPEGFNAVGIKAYYYELNEKGNTVSRTANTYELYQGGETLYVADLFKF